MGEVGGRAQCAPDARARARAECGLIHFSTRGKHARTHTATHADTVWIVGRRVRRWGGWQWGSVRSTTHNTHLSRVAKNEESEELFFALHSCVRLLFGVWGEAPGPSPHTCHTMFAVPTDWAAAGPAYPGGDDDGSAAVPPPGRRAAKRARAAAAAADGVVSLVDVLGKERSKPVPPTKEKKQKKRRDGGAWEGREGRRRGAGAAASPLPTHTPPSHTHSHY